jgi:undecaprenyl-diphosphatase
MNLQIFNFLYNFAHQFAFVDKLIIFCAVYLPYLVTLGALIFILSHHKSWTEVIRVFASGVVAWITASVLKMLVHTPRPFNAISTVHSLFPESGYAFPSGHATFFSAIAFAIYFKHKKAGYIFLACALIIGLARIAGGVHYPIDILGGYVLGFLVAFSIQKFKK